MTSIESQKQAQLTAAIKRNTTPYFYKIYLENGGHLTKEAFIAEQTHRIEKSFKNHYQKFCKKECKEARQETVGNIFFTLFFGTATGWSATGIFYLDSTAFKIACSTLTLVCAATTYLSGRTIQQSRQHEQLMKPIINQGNQRE